MVRARLRRESEHAADDLELSREVRKHERTQLPAPAMARPSHLERRLSAMLNPRTNRRSMTRLARFASLGVLVVASVVVAGLRFGPVTAVQETMYRVDYVKTRTRGATVLELEEGTHTFAPTGHRRVDRVVDGERTTTEIVVPETAGGGRQIVIDYSQGVVRTGSLNVATRARSSMPALPALPAGGRVVSMTRTFTRDGVSAPLRYFGAEARGPLTLHHYRAELPTGDIVDHWEYRFQNFDPVFDLGPSLRLAESSLSTAPDGAPELRETQIVNVTEVEFDPDAFTFDPALGFRVEDLWDALAR